MKHYFYALGAILCWASLPAATGAGLNELSTEELMFYSFTTAALYLFLQNGITHRNFRLSLPPFKACLFGVWGLFFYHWIYYLALERAPLAEAAILATTWALWIVIFSSVLLLKRLAPSILGSALLGFFGAALVIGAGKDLSFESTHMKGYLLALCCGVIWSSFSVGLPRLGLKKEPMTFFTLLTALCSGGLYLVTMPHQVPSIPAILSALYLGLVPLGLSFFLWNRAVTGGNMVVIGFLSYLTPPLAVLLVALVHGEAISPQVLTGMGVIIVASMLGKYFLGKLSGNLTVSSKATVATTNSKSDKRCLTDGRFS
jgi:drug/metabolite transporter (DMT)-like permease